MNRFSTRDGYLPSRLPDSLAKTISEESCYQVKIMIDYKGKQVVTRTNNFPPSQLCSCYCSNL